MADENENPKEPEQAAVDEAEVDVELDDHLAEALGESEPTAEGDVDIDQLIAEADPEFSEELKKISDQDFSGVIIETDSVSDEVDDNATVPSAWRSLWNNMPEEFKKRYFLAAGVVAILLPLALLIYMGKILPRFELPYVLSMSELSQKIYPYPTDGVEVPLFDEYRTKTFTVQLPKTVINLKPVGDRPSYGEFEFSLVLRDEDLSSAIEAKKSEIIDLLQRVLEQMTWKDVETPIGKERAKKVIRHRINEYLQGNVVLGVYYKHVLVEK